MAATPAGTAWGEWCQGKSLDARLLVDRYGGIIGTSQLAGARALGGIPVLDLPRVDPVDLPQSADPDDGRWSRPDRRRCVKADKR